MVELGELWIGGLNLANQVLAATIVLTSFSLMIYLLTHNFRSAVARAFCALLAFVLIVYMGDVLLYEVETLEAAERWLKFQWIGIAWMPAAYLDFSNALLRATHWRSRWQWFIVFLSYGASLSFLGLVIWTDLLVYDGVFIPQASHLAAGPFFWVFAFYFFVTVAWGAVNIRRARQRCLTRASRRRMTYLGLAFFAPALGSFPYLVIAGIASPIPVNILQPILLLGNIGVLLMIVLMAYSVAYFGALTPDRVIKHNLLHYLLRGPVVGAAVIFTMLAVPKVQQILGLTRDTVLIFAVVGVIIFLQLIINRAKPFIDRLIYRQDQEEIAWIQTLDRRLLTTGDLHTFLENSLAALCDLLRVRTGFVAVLAGGRYCLETYCGDRTSVQDYLQRVEPKVMALAPDGPEGEREFVAGDGFWLTPLSNRGGDVRLGVLGIQARNPQPDLRPEEKKIAALLVNRVQEALEDRYLQQNIFDTLRRILPNIEQLQKWQDVTRYRGSPPMQIIEDNPIYSPEFPRWVKEALGHYWGGPRLTKSPLMALRIVQDEIQEHGESPPQALRVVLNRAIERLRPEGERKMIAAEWLLYNILEMKFIRGLKMRDIAGRLAMSESDLYRKQRVAIAEVARALADLEQNGAGLALETLPHSQPLHGDLDKQL
ncbi:MAG: histidine kinase N-terminal 7TM domain-containing protein [Anaerolineae bacterium]